MPVLHIPIWKQAPFLRLILPLICGILTGYYIRLPLLFIYGLLAASVFLLILFNSLRVYSRYRSYFTAGIIINLVIVVLGILLTYYSDVKNDARWIGHAGTDYESITAVITEPLSEKPKSYKTIARIESIQTGAGDKKAKGQFIVYFQKNDSLKKIAVCTRIKIRKRLQLINATGNPGSFDYKEYSSLQGVYHQVYLSAADFHAYDEKQKNWLKVFIYSSREEIIAIINKYIPGKREAGLAEALLIGYKDDLDKTLVQSYANTGVVHVIAISGLHLGLIYWLLAMILKVFAKSRIYLPMKAMIIITGLWTFSLLAGASPSVLRSAVMFTCIVIGESIGKKTSIYNSLAASAFFLLCFNPYWLWDTGFQLSYIAVLSLVLFMQPVYNSIYIKNKLLDQLWKLTAVTIAAQVLTVPLSIYLFHQLPVYFLVTNLIAIPLSSIILLGEILLCVVAFYAPFAHCIGKVLECLIKLMNRCIEYMELLPAATIQELSISFTQLILLYIIILCFSRWLMVKSSHWLLMGIVVTALVLAVRTNSFKEATAQEKLIVYQTKGKVLEYIIGKRNAIFLDQSMIDNPSQTQFLKPSAIIHRISASTKYSVQKGNLLITTGKWKILWMDSPLAEKQLFDSIIDIVVLSGAPQVSINKISEMTGCRKFVFDATNNYRSVQQWKRECDDINIDCWSVSKKGAFIINVN